MYKYYLNKISKPFLFTCLAGLGIYNFKKDFFFKKAYSLAKDPNYSNKDKIPEFFENADVNALSKQYSNLLVLNSKAVDVLIGKLRDKNLSREQFRVISRRIIRFIIEEALAMESDEEIIRESPLGYYKTLNNPRDINDYVAVSIMRSGNGMVEEIMTVCPDINIGKVLLQRDEATADKTPIFFFEKLPKNLENKRILVLDPMLGTGGSVACCIRVLKEKGVKEENVIFLNMIASVDGIHNVFKAFPKIKIISAKVDKDLLPNKYIAPGIGDFGDRYYGTDH